MNNNMMELNLNEMEKVNGGFDWVKAVVWGTVGATVGAGQSARESALQSVESPAWCSAASSAVRSA